MYPLSKKNRMASHIFFCSEVDCEKEAHVSGGRCDECFNEYVKRLTIEHNPPQSDAEWLEAHDCNGFHYNEGLEVYTCEECTGYYDSLRQKRDLAMFFYHGVDLSGVTEETEEGYEAALAWYRGELGRPPTHAQKWKLREKLLTWRKCEEECLGCAGPSKPGANGYCSGCWNQRYGSDDHVCSGPVVDNGWSEYYACDNNDSPRCPSYQS